MAVCTVQQFARIAGILIRLQGVGRGIRFTGGCDTVTRIQLGYQGDAAAMIVARQRIGDLRGHPIHGGIGHAAVQLSVVPMLEASAGRVRRRGGDNPPAPAPAN